MARSKREKRNEKQEAQEKERMYGKRTREKMKRGEAGKRKKMLATLIERKEDKKIKINVRF